MVFYIISLISTLDSFEENVLFLPFGLAWAFFFKVGATPSVDLSLGLELRNPGSRRAEIKNQMLN